MLNGIRRIVAVADGRRPRQQLECEQVWAEYPSDKLSSIFDTKKLICPCIVEVEGSNSYQMPHKKKAKTA